MGPFPQAAANAGPSPSDPSLRGASSSFRGQSDPLSVVVFTLTAFTDRLSKLERANQELCDLVQNRVVKLEDSLQMHMDTLQMHILEPLQAAASSASKIQDQMDTVVSSVKDLVNPAHSSLVQISDQVRGLCNDVGDLNRTFVRIEDFCRRRPPTARQPPPHF